MIGFFDVETQPGARVRYSGMIAVASAFFSLFVILL